METLDFSPRKSSLHGQTGLHIPLTLQSVSQLQKRSSSHQQLEQYKKNMRAFIMKVQSQIALLVRRHSDQVSRLNIHIKHLQKQNTYLKQRQTKSNPNNVNPQQYINGSLEMQKYKRDRHPSKSERIGFQKTGECWSPIPKKRNNSINLLATASQNFQQNCKPRNSNDNFPIKSSSTYQKKNHQFTLDLNFNSLKSCNRPSQQFPMQILDGQAVTPRNHTKFGKSRFESNSQKKKMRREQVIQYLQSGSKNLDENTNKMLMLLGKLEPQREQESQQVILEPLNKKDKSEELNSSLGQICGSLDNSFASKRSRAKRSALKQAQTKEAQAKKERQIEYQKKKKQKGVKSVLRSIRDCIQYSPKKPQIVKGSKLLNTGNLKSSVGKNSKVLINPVPVQTTGVSRTQTIESPRKSSGILKRNSILTKSIEGISAISIHQ